MFQSKNFKKFFDQCRSVRSINFFHEYVYFSHQQLRDEKHQYFRRFILIEKLDQMKVAFKKQEQVFCMPQKIFLEFQRNISPNVNDAKELISKSKDTSDEKNLDAHLKNFPRNYQLIILGIIFYLEEQCKNNADKVVLPNSQFVMGLLNLMPFKEFLCQSAKFLGIQKVTFIVMFHYIQLYFRQKA